MNAQPVPQHKIQHDERQCAGLGICESLAPEHFEILDDGSLTVVAVDVSSTTLSQVAAAVRACPTRALTLAPATD